MSKFLKRVLFVFCYCGLFYTFSIIIWGEACPEKVKEKSNFVYPIGSIGHLHTKIREANKLQKVDFLILGSSHAYRSIDTRIFESRGYNIYNFGSSSQSPVQMRYIIDQYLTELNPKVVFIEVYPYTFQSDGIESSLDFIANGYLSKDLISMIFKTLNIKTFNALIFKVYRSLFKLDEQYYEPLIREDGMYVPGGFVERKIDYYNIMKFETKEWSFRSSQAKHFRSTLNTIKENNIDIVLFQAPISRSLYSSYTNNVEIDSYFESFGYKYINFNKIESLSKDSLFFDHHHLNQLGVELFDQEFIEVFKHYLE